MSFKIFIFFVAVFISSCHLPVDCNDGDKSYKYWAGEMPPKDVKIINGQYKQSMHFTLEYWLYLELKPLNSWWSELIETNSYISDTSELIIPLNAPKWFTPSKHSIKWKSPDYFNESRLIQDTLTGKCFIYVAQY